MRKAVVVIAALTSALWNADTSTAGTFVLRSSTTGVIAAPIVVPPSEEPTTPMPPDTPAGFTLSVTGQVSVMAKAALDLRPVVAGASGKTTFWMSGRLPLGATFDAATGRIAGRALIAGNYTVWVSATDSSGAMVTAEVVIVVA